MNLPGADSAVTPGSALTKGLCPLAAEKPSQEKFLGKTVPLSSLSNCFDFSPANCSASKSGLSLSLYLC